MKRIVIIAVVAAVALFAAACGTGKFMGQVQAEEATANQAAETSIAELQAKIADYETKLEEARAEDNVTMVSLYTHSLAGLREQLKVQEQAQAKAKLIADGLTLVIDKDGEFDASGAAAVVGSMIGGPVGQAVTTGGAILAIGLQFMKLRERKQELRVKAEELRLERAEQAKTLEQSRAIVQSLEVLKEVSPEVKTAIKTHAAAIRAVQGPATALVDRFQDEMGTKAA